MIVRPSITQTASAYVQLAVSNESGTSPLAIRKGGALATLRQIKQTDVKHQQTAVITETTNRNTVASAHHSEDRRGDADIAERAETKAAAEKERHKEKNAIWYFIHTKSGHQIITAVKAGEQIGSISFPDWVKDVGDHLKFGPRTTPQLKEDTPCLLYAMRTVVAKNPETPGAMKGFEGVIKVVDPSTTPVKCKHRRYSPNEKAIIRAETQELLDNGMIDVSDSPWSAPVVLVKRSDGKWRFCVSYTATVNRFLRHDAQPLPKSHDVLDNLAESTPLSLWGVCSGYWHIRLREQDRKFTAFSTDNGLWQWTRLPFGLATSGSQFVRSIEQVLREDHPDSVPAGVDPETGVERRPTPILHDTVEMFVDDGTIHTRDNQDHVDEITRCLKQLTWHDIAIKLAKCTWGTDKANLIGHEVSCGQGVRADTDKVADLLAMSHLETIGDLKSFLGACVYLSRFINDYALITAPLYALEASQKTGKNKIRHTGDNANWTPQHERAFKTLTAALGTVPCLAFPDWSRPFIGSAECSKCQMG